MTGEIELIPGRVLGDTELVDNAKLNDLGRPVLRIKAGAVGTREMANGIITADKLAADLTAQLGVADGSVSTAKIVDAAVTEAKLEPGVVDRLVAAGAVLQVVQDASAVTSANTNIYLLNDTTPVHSNGTQILTKDITPASATNKVLVSLSGTFTPASGNHYVTAVFRGTTCIWAADVYAQGANQIQALPPCNFLDSPASTLAQTYSVRVGPAAATTMYINRQTSGSANYMGGAAICTLTLTEIKG